MKSKMSVKNLCGGCKYFCYPDRCFVSAYGKTTTEYADKCESYRPLGTEPTGGMCYADFVKQCSEFYQEHLITLGYCGINFEDLSMQNWAMYHMTLIRLNPRSGKKEFVLNLDFEPTSDNKKLMLYENFENFSQIPEEYDNLVTKDILQQPPQFVYGYFSRLGDALNSTLKGCSIDLRKPKEIYY